jgi:hypothetical protein
MPIADAGAGLRQALLEAGEETGLVSSARAAASDDFYRHDRRRTMVQVQA